jgi:hypothetical protein
MAFLLQWCVNHLCWVAIMFLVETNLCYIVKFLNSLHSLHISFALNMFTVVIVGLFLVSYRDPVSSIRLY